VHPWCAALVVALAVIYAVVLAKHDPSGCALGSVAVDE
jgi:hypothetical protein